MIPHIANALAADPDLSLPADLRGPVDLLIQHVMDCGSARRVEQQLDCSSIERVFRREAHFEVDSLIALVGDRGSGKTTILFAACLELLRERRALVLPVTRPQDLRETTSIPLVLVGHLSEILREGDDVDDVDATALSQRAARSAALSGVSATKIVARGSESLSQIAIDTNGLARSHEELLPRLQDLIVAARRAVDVAPECPIVLPIDDLDLVPRRTTEMLADLRTLSALPGIVPVICANMTDLQNHVEADIRRDFSTLGESGIARRLTQQLITKALPPVLTVRTPKFSPVKRREFIPLGFELTMLDQLRGLAGALLSPVERNAFNAWLAGDESNVYNEVDSTLWLSGTARGLSNTWQMIGNAAERVQQADFPNAAIWLNKVFAEIASDASFAYEISVHAVEEVNGHLSSMSYEAYFSGVQFGIRSTGPWRSVTQSPLQLEFRRFATVDGAHSSPTGDAKPELLQSEVSALLLIQELLQSPLFASPRVSTPSFIGGGDYSNLQRIRILNLDTDDDFFDLPVAVGGGAVNGAKMLWNDFINPDIAPLDNDGTGDLSSSRSETVSRFISKVVWEFSREAERAGLLNHSSIHQSIAAASRLYRRNVKEYDGHVFLDYSRAKAFCSWYEEKLPKLFHAEFLNADELTLAIDTWQSHVSLARDRDAMSLIRQNLARRIANSVSSAQKAVAEGHWFCGYTSLLERCDSSLVARISHLQDEYSRLRGRSRLAGIATRDYASVEKSGEALFSQVSSPAGDREFALLTNLLEQLQR